MHAGGHNTVMYEVREDTPRSAAADQIRIVAIAASLGGVQALCQLLRELPADFPVPVVVVQHLRADCDSALCEIVQRTATLQVKWAANGELLQGGTVYLAPPNHHLTITAAGFVSLKTSARVNWVPPAADVLFDSIARHFGTHALAIVLTGCLFDGTEGSVSIKRAGGWVLAQDEESSQSFDMPRSAIRAGAVDFVLSIENLPFAILSLVMTYGATWLFRVPSRLTAISGMEQPLSVWG
jgi:two-component system, chemotaxis family, protein-glutamate methylesterase/glutaminase